MPAIKERQNKAIRRVTLRPEIEAERSYFIDAPWLSLTLTCACPDGEKEALFDKKGSVLVKKRAKSRVCSY
jgi:hypothetical protein